MAWLVSAAACGGAPETTSPASAPAEPVAVAAPTPAIPRGPILYVTNERGGTVTLIDTVTQNVIATVALGKRPRGLAVSPDRTKVYVALSGSPIAGPGVDESKLPPADKGADGIGVVDTKTGQMLTMLRAGSDPETVAISHDGTRAFIANEDTAQASVVDAGGRTDRETLQGW